MAPPTELDIAALLPRLPALRPHLDSGLFRIMKNARTGELRMRRCKVFLSEKAAEVLEIPMGTLSRLARTRAALQELLSDQARTVS